MKYVSIPEIHDCKLPFYLAVEEYVARNLPQGEYFFTWQVNPTVIIGRHQVVDKEINMSYVREHNIQYYRRKSGGGCVYSDRNNIMMSYISTDFNVDKMFHYYLRCVCNALKEMGINAVPSGRNDIMINDRKVSGNAFYQMGNKCIVHGTMLIDTDIEAMISSITPSDTKLISKGVESVRQRVTNISEHIDITIADFCNAMRKYMCNEEVKLTSADVALIEELEQTYLTDEWIYGKNPKYTHIKQGKTDAGEIELWVKMKGNIIEGLDILGDYFTLNDTNVICSLLQGVSYDSNHIHEAIAGIDIACYIRGMSNAEFEELLLK